MGGKQAAVGVDPQFSVKFGVIEAALAVEEAFITGIPGVLYQLGGLLSR